MSFFNVNYETQESILESFDSIANKISKDISLKINDAIYRIIDFEYYAYSEKLSDPHTYKNDLQLQNGKLYLHGSGIDITFGDNINHGGILLRSVVKLLDDSDEESGFMKKQFEGPQVVATELFSNLHPLNSTKNNEIRIIDSEGQNVYKNEGIIKTKRVGLTPKINDKDDFYRNLPIRYIVILPKFPKFKQSIKGIESILTDKVKSGDITVDDAIKILGYNKNFV